MALPTAQKTWQYNVNQTVTAGATMAASYSQLMYKIKATLIGFTTLPWTVVASSNGTTADTSDNWASSSDVVFGTGAGARSWVVLKQTGLASNFQILIAAANGAQAATGEFGLIMASPSAGFTGLTSTTVTPTATDQYQINQPAAQWMFTTAAAFGFTLHGMMSDDGECTRIFVTRATKCIGALFIEKIQQPVTGMTNPVFAWCNSGKTIGSELLTTTNALSAAYGRGLQNSTPIGYTWTTEFYSYTTAIGSQTFNQISGETILMPCGAMGTTGAFGRHGHLADIWTGSYVTATTGDTYPNDSTRLLAHFGIFVVPWNGTAVVTT